MSRITSSNGEAGLNRNTLRDCISNKGMFNGVTGKMTVDNSREIDKELFVLGVEREKIILKLKPSKINTSILICNKM
mgnify:CR=1 FL=1